VDDGLQAQRVSEQDLKLPLNLISSLRISQQDLKLRWKFSSRCYWCWCPL
jgi:hypothetical protein